MKLKLETDPTTALTRDQIEAVRDLLADNELVLAAYLFGSRARGSEHARGTSDFDIALLFDGNRPAEDYPAPWRYDDESKLGLDINSLRSFEAATIQDWLFETFGYDNVDVISLRAVRESFRQTVLTGPLVLIFSRNDDKRVRQEQQLLSELEGVDTDAE